MTNNGGLTGYLKAEGEAIQTFKEKPDGGFECFVSSLSTDIIGTGLTIEEAEEDFNNKWNSSLALIDVDNSSENPNVTTHNIYVPLKRMLFLTRKTHLRVKRVKRLNDYFVRNQFTNYYVIKDERRNEESGVLRV